MQPARRATSRMLSAAGPPSSSSSRLVRSRFSRRSRVSLVLGLPGVFVVMTRSYAMLDIVNQLAKLSLDIV